MTALNPATPTAPVRVCPSPADTARPRPARQKGLVSRSIRGLFVAPRRTDEPDPRERREALGRHVPYGGADRHLRVF